MAKKPHQFSDEMGDRQGDVTVPRCRLSTYGCREFDYAGPTVWNSLPDELRNSDNFRSFKQFSLAATSVTSALDIL